MSDSGNIALQVEGNQHYIMFHLLLVNLYKQLHSVNNLKKTT